MGNLHTAINSGVIKGPGSPFYKAISSCSASFASPSMASQCNCHGNLLHFWHLFWVGERMRKTERIACVKKLREEEGQRRNLSTVEPELWFFLQRWLVSDEFMCACGHVLLMLWGQKSVYTVILRGLAFPLGTKHNSNAMAYNDFAPMTMGPCTKRSP